MNATPLVSVRRPRQSLRNYSRFVYASKLLLGCSIVVILVFLVAIPLLGQQRAGVRLAFSSIEEKKETAPVMLKPRLQGVDNNNQPYLVTADSAIQQDENTVILQNVTADLETNKKAWLALIAEQGMLNLAEQSLLLQGAVQLYHTDGSEMRTEQVRIDLNKSVAYGETPVQIQGDFGHVRADSFTFLEKGNRLLFRHHVKMMLFPSRQ
jgi:lipopolysaccharide export system protein LptC